MAFSNNDNEPEPEPAGYMMNEAFFMSARNAQALTALDESVLGDQASLIQPRSDLSTCFKRFCFSSKVRTA